MRKIIKSLLLTIVMSGSLQAASNITITEDVTHSHSTQEAEIYDIDINFINSLDFSFLDQFYPPAPNDELNNTVNTLSIIPVPLANYRRPLITTLSQRVKCCGLNNLGLKGKFFKD